MDKVVVPQSLPLIHEKLLQLTHGPPKRQSIYAPYFKACSEDQPPYHEPSRSPSPSPLPRRQAVKRKRSDDEDGAVENLNVPLLKKRSEKVKGSEKAGRSSVQFPQGRYLSQSDEEFC